MDNIKDYDDEGFELEFDDDTTEEERKYFVQAYSNVNMVADKRLHCTCCNVHIGTAPAAEKIIRMHPVLKVTQCVKCFRFYNSGEFDKGEDGSELYCRWCGQGGDVYCCSDCPYVFCKKCILRNLTKVALNNVTSNENWKCFSCAPKILYHLRAQHWALVNFIAKQKKKIEKMSKKRDQDEIVDAMNHDSSVCCQTKRNSIDSKKRRIICDDSEVESEDSNWSSNKRSKRKSVKNDSDAESVSSERSGKRTKTLSKSVPESVDKPTPSVSTPLVSTPSVSTPSVSIPSVSTPSVSTPSVSKKPDTPAQVTAKKAVAKPAPNSRKSSQAGNITAAATPPQLRQCEQSIEENAEATEIDCTPDLFAFLVNHSFEQTVGATEQSENSVSSSTAITSSVQGPSTSKSQTTSLQAPPQPRSVAQQRKSTSNISNLTRAQNVVNGPTAKVNNSQVQPPASREQFIRRVARSQITQSSTQPVYHNYNGYRIDLNSAAQQSTIRLPNGKVIHVKKQAPINNGRNEPTTYSITAAPTPNQIQPQRHIIQRVSTSIAPPLVPTSPAPPRNTARARAPPPPQQRMPAASIPPPPLVINSVSSGVRMPPLQVVMQQPLQQQQRSRSQGPRGQMISAQNNLPLQQAQMQMQMQMMQMQQTPQVQQAQNVPAQLPNIVAGPSAVAPRIYPNDSLGRARTQLERQIFNAMSICHQIDSKLKTLMNSNAYKNVQKLHDIKELYIHLSYLFTYTNGRFQTVHDKCMDDMRRLGFKNDASSLSSGNVIDKYGSDVDEDDLEIVEPTHQTINLDSDDERTPEKSKSKGNKTNNASNRRSIVPAPELLNSNHNDIFAAENSTGVMLDISSSNEHLDQTHEDLECDVDVASLLQINMNVDDEEVDHGGETLLTRMNDGFGIATPPETEQTETINIENDLKLNSKVTISLKPVEQEYPELMKEALQKMKESQVEKEEKEGKVKGAEELIVATPVIESPPQLPDKTTEKSPVQLSTENSNGNNDGRNEDVVQVVNLNENENETQSSSTKAPEDEPTKSAHEPIDCDEPIQSESQLNEKTINDEQNEIELPVAESVEEADLPIAVENEVELQQVSPIEATTSQPDDADFNENEAKSIENCSNIEGEMDTSNQESHMEITSTSMAIENDIEMSEIIDEITANDKPNDQIENGGNEVIPMDIVEDSTIEIIPDENLEAESILSDLSDLVADEISNVISTSDAINVASILDNDDFENISSPDTFN